MNVIVVGASGYSGHELIRILLQHPRVKITHLFANSQDRESILDIFPHMGSILNIPVNILSDLSEGKLQVLKESSDVVFLATPSGVSKEWGPIFLKNGFKVIDLSGDFRLKDASTYEKWYRLEAPSNDVLQQAIYGLSEWFPNQIRDANYIANPGCYATSILLALAPLFHHKLSVNSVIIDAKSGVSGAGKGYSRSTHYSETNENFKPYKVGVHQHIPEIEQVLTELNDKPVIVQMMTHLVPMTRGILSTIYVDFTNDMSYEEIFKLYQQDYEDQPFIRIRLEGEYPETKHVYGTNFCDIGLYVDRRTKRLVIFSVIDNLMKGAAGQAVQNMNLMMGWEQSLGLTFVPIYP